MFKIKLEKLDIIKLSDIKICLNFNI
jgi:hypothetical protein